MANTVVVQQVVPFEADGSWVIKGTIDGATHLMRWAKPFNPTEVTASALGQALLDDFSRMDQLVVNKIASRTVKVTHPRSTTQISVIFGDKATIYSQVGYDQVQISGTIDGVTYYVIMRQQDLVTAVYAGQAVAVLIAQRLTEASVLEGSWIGPYTATFALASTTSSSTTTTTSTTTTSTTTTSTTTTTTSSGA
jgi:hypothetical protein